MSVDFLSKNFPPFQVHHAKKPPRFYPDGFQRNVIDFYFIFSDCRLRKALYLQFSYFIWPLCDEALNNWWEHLADMDTYFHTYKRPEKGLARWGITLIPPSSIPQLRHVIETYTEAPYKADASEIISLLDKAIKNNSFVIHYGI